MEENSGNKMVSVAYKLPESFANLSDRIETYCQENEYKGLENKILVAAALYNVSEFIDAESLWLKILPKKKISRATIYLVLNWLVFNGFAEKKKALKRIDYYRLRSQCTI